MIVNYYGLLDTVAKEVISTFTAKGDDLAQRSCRYIVRDPKFDNIAGKDYVVVHLYDFDTCLGKIVPNSNDVRTVCAMSTFMAEFELEKLQANHLAEETKNTKKGKKDETKTNA